MSAPQSESESPASNPELPGSLPESPPESLTKSLPGPLSLLIERCLAVDGQPPFSDQSLVELAAGDRFIVEGKHSAALVSPTEFELAVAPANRNAGLGTELLRKVISGHPESTLAWAHGDHPAARALASKFGFSPIRILLQLRTSDLNSVPTEPGSDKDPVESRTDTSVLRSFQPGIDEIAWLDLNARAFASHPEQGKMTLDDLAARQAEVWFDPQDFLLLFREESLAGFCWLKVAGEVGEFYAVGVDPELQGAGVGIRLMSAGFARLQARKVRLAELYVEADNLPAMTLYRKFGFHEHSRDVQYRRDPNSEAAGERQQWASAGGKINEWTRMG